MTRERYDAVVVGAGPNGLAAAITLARRGRSVLVLETAATAGGAVKTEELTLPGFRHDVFSSVYPAAVASPVFGDMPLERHGLRWVHPPVAMAHPMPEGRAVALYPDLDRTAANLDELAPGDGRAWRGLVGPYVEHFDAVRRTMMAGFPPVEGPLRVLGAFGLGGALEFARLVLLPAQALAAELPFGEHATAWLYGSAMHGDVAVDAAGSAVAAVYLNLLGHVVGWPSPEGGAAALTDALVGYLAELGGQVRTGARVDRVVTARGRVAGVALDGGDCIRANVAVCDVTPHTLLRLAGDALHPAYRARLARYRYGPHTLKVDWALTGPVPWTAPEAREAGTVHVGGPARELARAAVQVRFGEVPDRPFSLFGQQSLADPTRAPVGRHTAWAYTRVPHGVDWGRESDRHVARVEAQVERFAPGFCDRILARHVLTPPAIEARNAGLPGGDVGTGSYALDQLVFRPVPGLSPYRTPVAGLYIGSAAAFPGGAVHGIPGRAAARVALAESALRRW